MATILGLEETIFVGLDIGTSKICMLVGHSTPDGKLRVIGIGEAPSKGMRKGGVVNLEALAQAIRIAKDKAERTSGYEITSAMVSLSGSHISSLNSKGLTGVTGRTISGDDVGRAIEAARSIVIPYDRVVVHVIPRAFVVDGQDGIKSAIGMHGYRLEVETHIITASSTALRNLEKCIEAAGIDVDGWVLGSLASAGVTLSETEQEMGVMLCDIGAGTTDIAIYIEGAVWHTAVIPVGGEHLSNDIAQVLHLPHETAESAKRRHGYAKPSGFDPDQAFAVRPFGAEQSIRIKCKDMAVIIEPRIEELFSLVRQEVKRSGYDGLLPAGIVLAGGTSQLPGIRDVANEILHLPVRIAEPERMLGLVDRLRSPAYAASLGLLYWAQVLGEESGVEGFSYAGFTLPNFSLEKTVGFFKRLLPG
ncbi:MAG: cell division protein FtsA [Anaerolineales bacterium]|nr:cell division protein FtsA [Anaerolineales bacterium]